MNRKGFLKMLGGGIIVPSLPLWVFDNHKNNNYYFDTERLELRYEELSKEFRREQERLWIYGFTYE